MFRKIWRSRLAALIKRASSLRLRIVLLAVVAVAPLVFERARTLENNHTERIAAAGGEALALARASADKQDDILTAARSLLQTVGHSIDLAPAGSHDCNRLLADVASDVPWMRSIGVINREGKFVCASNPRMQALDVSDRSYFNHAWQDGGFVISDLIYPRSGEAPGLVIAYAKRRAGGEVESVIAALVYLRWIGQLGEEIDKRPQAQALMVDSAGTVLAAHPSPDAWIGRDFSTDPLLREVGGRAEGTVASAGFGGARRIWGFVAIPEARARLFVGLDERKALSQVDHAMRFAYVQLAFISVLVLLGAWLFGEHAILRPIRKLARAAERIGRGDLTVRTGERAWATEFLPLTRSLDSMAARLAAREHDLRSESDHFRELAERDPLTGLCNRRAFDAALADAWQAAELRGEDLALMMIDVDHFKRYNDIYGHLAGDAALRAIAFILASAGAPAVCAARYGGEEFALLAPGATDHEVARLGEALRRAVEARAIAHAGAPSGVVTVSVGLASLRPGRGLGIRALIAAADNALYRSKRRRNTVTIYAAPALAKAS
jgi:diguanylate cyclase (GGDEF)-like protein